MIVELNGIVIRTIDLTGSDQLLTLYTAEKGLMTAIAKGSKSWLNKAMVGAQLFCYSRFLLYRRGDKYWIKEAEILEHFYGVRQDITRTALASYVCDVVGEIGTNQADIPLLRLTLNTLFAISQGAYTLALIKAAFEWRVAAIMGVMPDVDGCDLCGREEGDFLLYVMDGVLVCNECREEREWQPPQEGERRVVELIPPGVLSAVRYVLHCPLEKLFSFRLKGDEVDLFYRAAESYLTNHVERGFKSLTFYHQVKD